MHLILLSGGSGKRLWPLSNESRSKQFLKLLQNEQGEQESMTQRVCRQIRENLPDAALYVATSAMQQDIIQNQIGGQAELIVEPQRRNTFPAIALSCAYLYYQKKLPPDETVIVLPVDPYAETAYFQKLLELYECIKADCAPLALMGVKPGYPAEKYGYILPGEPDADGVRLARGFKEKPSLEQAEALIGQGALWNCGVFAFRLGFVTGLLHKQAPVSSYEDVLEAYSSLPARSFDYEVTERLEKIAVIEYDGVWADIGTWNTLAGQMPRKSIGRVLMGADNENTHVINELGIPVLVMGAKNMVIAASCDGIFVADKEKSSFMKPLVEQIHQRPMFEERRWGEYRVVDFTACPGGKSLTKRMFIRAGEQVSCQYHLLRSETWIIVSGTGELYQDGVKRTVTQGDSVRIPPGSRHAIKALSDLGFIEVQIGGELTEEDVVRLSMSW